MRKPKKVLLLTPPFVQLNAPYAAVPFLAGTLERHGYTVVQRDLSIAVALRLFSSAGLEAVFAHLPARLLSRGHRDAYRAAIGPVVAFLQGKKPTLARRILAGRFLPEGPHSALFEQSPAAARLRGEERVRHRASLFLDDLTDLLRRALPHFGLSRYAERLACSPASFDDLRDDALAADDLIGDLLTAELAALPWEETLLVAVTIPFPGTLLGALRIGRFVKERYPALPIVFGGGYVNTELRDLRDPRLFDFCDYLVLDDGERPLLALLERLTGTARPLVRTFTRDRGSVRFHESDEPDLWGAALGTPRYDPAELDRFLDLAEIPNPMHRLWSRRDTLKLRLTHGCHWHRCAFCDTALPHIARYRPLDPALVAAQAAHLVETTGRRLFHFVDEALPPGLLRRFAEEVVRRDLAISWWGNIRFERGFDRETCRLLARSGCIGLTGGLEGVTDPMLAAMRKGITLAEAVTVLSHLRAAGIMTHAYLIYGFPGQSIQETVDGLEIVRQLFAARLLTSAYYHRFALTVHSPVYAEQEHFGISAPRRKNRFANNNITYRERRPTRADALGPGLHKALYNFLHDNLLDADICTFFDVPVPAPGVKKGFVRDLRRGKADKTAR